MKICMLKHEPGNSLLISSTVHYELCSVQCTYIIVSLAKSYNHYRYNNHEQNNIYTHYTTKITV